MHFKCFNFNFKLYYLKQIKNMLIFGGRAAAAVRLAVVPIGLEWR